MTLENSQSTKMGIREFRNYLTKNNDDSEAFVVTRHGRTVGYYIPVPVDNVYEDLNSLKQAISRISNLLKEKGISEDEIVQDFDNLRKGK
jgi:PHD/YefM family antitoxin component YafN of YafNO toxin-antitoxin module